MAIEGQRPKWMEQMAGSPFTKNYFTTDMQEKIVRQINNDKANHRLFARRKLLISLVCSFMILFGGIGLLWKYTNVVDDIVQYANMGMSIGSKARQAQVNVFPDGGMTAGYKTTYLWVFERPLDQLKGSEMSVKAIYQPTGEVLNVVPSKIINESIRRTDNQTGVVTSFGLPYAGKWQLEVSLDGNYFADVEINAPEPDWTTSGSFQWNDMEFNGKENRIGVRGMDFEANNANKYMWYLKGSEDELSANRRVIAIQQNTGRVELIVDSLAYSIMSKENEQIESYIPCLMNLPAPGLWRLTVMTGDQLFDSIVVQVK
ncbi:DUF4871 domain-containing protein [Paenibacillus albiflavus]|uniref:DUF4871 domain-containing protein n=1 Tax=Paenibacillus albiflavus TaxID=2545760 RepID=A0A4R4EIG8_9BACL|nr:DUF4871 domain-containing protein [Paenibacillus albiflavus]TCZ79944.1 DUF4871 domain-containing protein [Paenibacillus albiflavus]